MKNLGVVRKGRLVIPKEVSDTKGWSENIPMEMDSTEDGLLIKGYQPSMEKQEILNDLYEVLRNSENEEVQTIIGRAIDFVNKS
jgi:bifunctional DNA-binding transcriptional regulator/antitoxin component of YhaV-PrlF toxin-antitoxin module